MKEQTVTKGGSAVTTSGRRQNISNYLLGEMYPYFQENTGNVFLSTSEGSQKTVADQADLCMVSHLSEVTEKGYWDPPDLIVEIFDASSKTPAHSRFEFYESCGVKEYWEVFPDGPALLVHSQYKDGHYQLTSAFGKGAKVSPTGFSEVVIDLEELFDLAEYY